MLSLSRQSARSIFQRIALLISFFSAACLASSARPPDAIRTHADPAQRSIFAGKFPISALTGKETKKPNSLSTADATGRKASALAGLKSPPRIVLFVLDRVGLRDIATVTAPHLRRFFQESAIGLMNFASASGRSRDGAYVSISAGTHAAAVAEAGLIRGAGEAYEEGFARDAFRRRTGLTAGPDALFELGLAPLLKANEDKSTMATPGALGEIASAYGPTVAIGNGDAPTTEATPLRFAPLLAMNLSGIIDRGDLSGDLLHPDSSAPYGTATDPVRLEAAYLRHSPGASLVVIDLGETTRANDYMRYLPKSLYPACRLSAVARADALFDRLMSRIDLKRTRVLLVTPCPAPNDEGEIQQLAPVAISGLGSGLLTSGTTQGAGMIANIDLAPTLAETLRSSGRMKAGASLKTDDALMMTGEPIRFVSDPSPLDDALRLDSAVTAQRRAASDAFLPILSILAVLLAGTGLLLAWPRERSPRFPAVRQIGRFCLCLVILSPLSLVIAGRQMPVTLYSLVEIASASWLALALILSLLGSKSVPAAMLVCGIGLIADLLTGGLGLRLSPISDFPIIGVRFHGFGNEYTGVTIGAILMGACGLFDFFPSLTRAKTGLAALWILFAGTAIVIGAPGMGDDAGGLIAAIFGFGALLMKIHRLPLSVKNLLGLLAFSLASVWLVASIDSGASAPTHYGRSLILARQGGAGYLMTVIERKIMLNLRFMSDFRAWIAYAGIAVLLYIGMRRAPSQIRQTLAARPGLAMGFPAALAGSVAAWAFNDTGILPAMLILSVALLAFIAAMLEPAAREAEENLIQILLE